MPQCSPNTPSRKIIRDVHEDARDHARGFVGTPEFEQSRDERKKVEMRFAHLKIHHRFERMRLRGLSGARDEFHGVAIVQDLKTLAGQLWQTPPDALAASAISEAVASSVRPRSKNTLLIWRIEASKVPIETHTPLIRYLSNDIDPFPPRRSFAFGCRRLCAMLRTK